MPLELRWKLSGSLRPYWYGRYEAKGKRYCPNLGVKIAGTPPASMSLKDEGDTAFERSRAAAQAKLDSIVEEAHNKRNAALLVERLYEIRTGEPIKVVKMDDLAEEWAKIERKRQPDERYRAQYQSALRRFAAFVRQENSKAEEITQVTRAVARAFLDAETQRGIAPKTWNNILKLLRTTFRHLLPGGAVNPFAGTLTKDTETIFRVPYTPEELQAIIEAARDHDFIRPIIVIGICTAMREGDCCLLKWKDVDLARRFITVKTAKTGATVSIPIFPMLRDELERKAEGRRQRAEAVKGESDTSTPHSGRGTEADVAQAAGPYGKGGEGYVFPEQARMYLENQGGITWQVRKVLAAAGFRDSEAMAKNGSSSSRSGEGTAIRGEIHAERKNGLRRASIRDFHSFRVTWVTLALTAGVPLELVQKVTGHKTTDIVLKHYFQPSREDFRQALNAAMPKLLTNGYQAADGTAQATSPKHEMREIIERMTAETWKKDKVRLLELLRNI